MPTRSDCAGLTALPTRLSLGETFFNENTGRPGADPQVRLALTTGSDVPQLMKVATNGRGVLSTGLVTIDPKPCQGDTVTGNLPAYDAAKAKSILDADGWVAGSDGIRTKGGKKLTIKFIYPQQGGDALAAAAELLAQEWKALGVDITASVITATQLNDVLFASGDWDAGWVPVGVSLPTQLVGFLSGPAPATNFAHINNTAYTTDATKAAATGDVTQACALWNSAETALIKNIDVAPMFDSTLNHLSEERDRDDHRRRAHRRLAAAHLLSPAGRVRDGHCFGARERTATTAKAGANPWVKFLIRRLGRLAISVWVLVTFSFLIIHLIPGDPVRAALGITADPTTVAAMRHDLGLDQPLLTQYVHYIGNLLHGDLGISLASRLPVSTVIAQRAPNTLMLAGVAFVVIVIDRDSRSASEWRS